MKKIPKFKSEEEEARFWETHSPLDYSDDFTDVKEALKFSPDLLEKAARGRDERKRQLTLRMGQHQIDWAKVIAKWKGLAYQTQIRMWVIEGIRRELAAHPGIKKFASPKR